MGLGRCMATPPRPSWDLAMGLGMEKPKAVAGCLLAGYREWTIKGFKGQDPKLTTIDPDMEKDSQLIEDDSAARFDELVGRVSHISKDKLDNSHMALPDHEKLLRYRAVRTAAIVAEMKRRGVEVTEMNAVHLAAILCAAVPTDLLSCFLTMPHSCLRRALKVAQVRYPWIAVRSRQLNPAAGCG